MPLGEGRGTQLMLRSYLAIGLRHLVAKISTRHAETSNSRASLAMQRYSARNASSGSSFAALRAGSTPAMSPIDTAITIDSST